MADLQTVLGIDIGSHGVRCRLGETVRSVTYDGLPPPAARSANELCRAVFACLSRLPPEARARCEAVGITGVRGAVLGLDAANRPMTPITPDFDPECLPIARNLAQRLGDRVFAQTGCPPFLLSGLPKMLRLAGTAEDLRFTTPPDFVALLLTGKFALSQGMALRLGCLTPDGTKVNRSFLAEAGLSAACLAPLVPIGAPMGHVTPAAAAETALPAGVPVIACPGDGPAARAVVAECRGDTMISLGTSTVVLAGCNGWPKTEGGLEATVEFDGNGGRLLEYGSGIGGAAIDWLARLTGQSPSELEALSQMASADATVLASPLFLSAWGSPEGGQFARIALDDGPPELAAALFGAIGADAARSVDHLVALGCQVDRIFVTGGVAGSQVTLETLAAALGRAPIVADREALAATGAARIAAAGIGVTA